MAARCTRFSIYYILQLLHAFFQQFSTIKMTQQVNIPQVINLPKNYVYVSNLVNQSQLIFFNELKLQPILSHAKSTSYV